MDGGISNGDLIWKKWEKVLNDFLIYKKTKRYEKLTAAQKKEVSYNVSIKLKALSRLANLKDLEYLKHLKAKYERPKRENNIGSYN